MIRHPRRPPCHTTPELAGEEIDIEPGGWIYKDRPVQMQTMFQRLSTGLFASGGQIVWNRFIGPGKIALQFMYFHMEGGE